LGKNPHRDIIEVFPRWRVMPSLLALTVVASSATAVMNFAGWWFVWKHDHGAEKMEEKKISDQFFWYFFSYLLPLLPAIITILGPDGGDIFNAGFTSGLVTVLAITMGVLMIGLSISNFNWIRRDKERAARLGETTDSTLPEVAKMHLKWTTTLTFFVGILWWYIVFL